MEKRLVFAVSALVALCAVASAGTLTLSPDGGTFTWTATAFEDAMVDQNASGPYYDTNFGSQNRLETDPPSRATKSEPVDANGWGKKSYIHFDLPSESNYGEVLSNFTVANIVAASFKLTAEADANNTYHDFNSTWDPEYSTRRGSLRLAALRDYYDTTGYGRWDEDTLTYHNSLDNWASVSSGAPSDDGKYFIDDDDDYDPNHGSYPDPNTYGYPTMGIINGYWVNGASFNTVRSVWFDLLNVTSNDANGARTYQVVTGGDSDDGNNNLANFLDLIDLDSDDVITFLLGANHATYFQSSEAGNPSDRPTLTISFVPEPATLTVLGLGAMALIRRRRRT